MRNLTIKREKSFVACLAKMKVYLEDDASSEIVVNNVSYRKIGELKNGEEKVFSINEDGCNIIVIADKLSKSYCNELYRIPSGEDDIFLSGKNVLNLAAGNAFRFNAITDTNILQNRKKGFKKGLVVLCVCIAIGVVGGFFITNALLQNRASEPKVFSKDGITLTLTDQFSETPDDNFTVCYLSKDVAVLVLKEEFSSSEGFDKYTLNDYGNLLITANNFDSSVELQSSDGLTYFEYQYSDLETKELYNYFSVIFKATDSFWMVQFAALEQNYSDEKPAFIDWAKKIEFSSS